jgi:hypothetical protein
MSVFSSSDLKQAVKYIPDKEVQERLIEEALAGESVINLLIQRVGKQTFTLLSIFEPKKKK